MYAFAFPESFAVPTRNMSNENKNENSKPAVNPENLDWRTPLIHDLAKRAHERGLELEAPDFNYNLQKLFYDLAEEELTLPEERRVGYTKALKKYKDVRAFTHIFTLVKKHWPASLGTIQVNIQKPAVLEQAQRVAVQVPVPKAPKKLYDEQFEHVLSLNLIQEFDAEGVRKSLEDCLRARFPDYAISILEARVVSKTNTDLLVKHSGYVSVLCESLETTSWIAGVWSKPHCEFGLPIAWIGAKAA